MSSHQSSVSSRQSENANTKPFRVASYKLQIDEPAQTRGKCGLSVIWRSIKSSLWVMVLLLVILLLIVGCTNNAVSLATFTPPAVQPKILVTVYISPTPNAEQRQTLAAANPSTLTPIVMPTSTATPYVGVFLG